MERTGSAGGLSHREIGYDSVRFVCPQPSARENQTCAREHISAVMTQIAFIGNTRLLNDQSEVIIH